MPWARSLSDAAKAGRSIAVLPPHDLWEPWTGEKPSQGEDRELPYRILRGRGIRTRRFDIHRWPLNPAARAHPLLRAIDPVRALHVLLFARSTDVVLCFFESAALLPLLLRRLLLFRGRVVVVDVGALEGWRLRRRLQDLVIPRADLVLPYSAHQAAAIARTWPGAAGRVQPVLAHVDCAFFAEAADQPDGPVLAVGDDISRDYPTLLRAAEGLGRPVTIRTRLIAPGSALPPNVTILAAPLPDPAYRDLIASAAVVVLPLHPSGYAGGVSALVQAMASGKALVVAASSGIAEYVTDGVTALVVPCHDADALRGAIGRLLDDAGLRRRLGSAARAFAVRRLSLEAWADRLETVVGAMPGGERR